jgi:hypothetical protein
MKETGPNQGIRVTPEENKEPGHGRLVEEFPKFVGHALSLNPTLDHPGGMTGALVYPTLRKRVLVPSLMISRLGQQEKLIKRSQVAPA